MAITSGFFNSVDGDRTYNAEQMSTYFEGLVSNGIYENVDDRFVVTAGDGMTINVGSGRALIDCHWIKNDAAITLTIEESDVQYGRVDAVVLRLDKNDSARDISVLVKTGEMSSSPVPPELTQGENIYELCLAYIKVNANVTSMSQSAITDTRSSSMCGWVTGIIKQVDTSELFLQYQTAYEEQYAEFDAYLKAKKSEFEGWFNTLTETLHVDTSIVKYQYVADTDNIDFSFITMVPTGNKQISDVIFQLEKYEEGDILMLFIGGVLLSEGNEYVVSGAGTSTTITFPNNIVIGANETVPPLTAIVIKSVIGAGVVSEIIDDINGEVV